MTTLGTHDTHLLLIDHGRNRLGSFLPRDVSSIKWSREKNEVTQAVVTMTVDGSLTDALEPWLHQLAIFRNDQPVWRGFVLATSAKARELTVVARDPAAYFAKRRVSEAHYYREYDVSYIAAEIVKEAVAAFDPFGIAQNLLVEPTGIVIDLDLKPEELYVSEVLKNLVEVGLQWTVTGGRMVIGPMPRHHVTAAIEDRHMEANLTVEKDGTEQVNDLIALGKGASGAYFDYQTGLNAPLQGIAKGDNLTADWQCINEARKQIRRRAVAPRRLTMGGAARLLPVAPVSVTELVPGCLVPVQTEMTGVLIGARMELTAIECTASVGKDEVAITLGDEPIEIPIQDQLSPTRTSLDDD